ncbi:hypothetical protein AHAS_Ahas02G0155800 [Arachis hypogaea]
MGPMPDIRVGGGSGVGPKGRVSGACDYGELALSLRAGNLAAVVPSIFKDGAGCAARIAPDAVTGWSFEAQSVPHLANVSNSQQWKHSRRARLLPPSRSSVPPSQALLLPPSPVLFMPPSPALFF